MVSARQIVGGLGAIVLGVVGANTDHVGYKLDLPDKAPEETVHVRYVDPHFEVFGQPIDKDTYTMQLSPMRVKKDEEGVNQVYNRIKSSNPSAYDMSVPKTGVEDTVFREASKKYKGSANPYAVDAGERIYAALKRQGLEMKQY